MSAMHCNRMGTWVVKEIDTNNNNPELLVPYVCVLILFGWVFIREKNGDFFFRSNEDSDSLHPIGGRELV